MSILNGMTTIVTYLRNSIDTEEERLEKDLQSSIQKIVSETTSAFQVLFSDIMGSLQTAGEIVETDLQKIESGLTSVVSTLESTAESEYQFFAGEVEASITMIKGVASDVANQVGAATSYLRTGAPQEFDALMTKTRTDFDKAKNDFKTAITGLAASLVSKARDGVASVVSSAQSDIDRLKAMRTSVVNELTSKVGEIGSDIKAVKDRAAADVERIIGMMKQELDKMETRVDKMEGRINRVGMIIGAVSLCVAIASGVRIVQQAHEGRLRAKHHKQIEAEEQAA